MRNFPVKDGWSPSFFLYLAKAAFGRYNMPFSDFNHSKLVVKV